MNISGFDRYLDMGFKYIVYTNDGFEFPHDHADNIGGFSYCTEEQLDQIHNNLQYMLCPDQEVYNKLRITRNITSN